MNQKDKLTENINKTQNGFSEKNKIKFKLMKTSKQAKQENTREDANSDTIVSEMKEGQSLQII